MPGNDRAAADREWTATEAIVRPLRARAHELRRAARGAQTYVSVMDKGFNMSGLGLWDPRKSNQTWPEPVIFQPQHRRLYRGDPQQLRNAVRFAGRRTPIQVCNQRMLSGVEDLGYVVDGDYESVQHPGRTARASRTPARPIHLVSRMSLDRRWAGIRDYMERMARYARALARARALGDRAAVQRNQRFWRQARGWAIRDLTALSAVLARQHQMLLRQNRGKSSRRVREAHEEWVRAAALLAALQTGNRSSLDGLGSCCAPCRRGEPCAGKAGIGVGVFGIARRGGSPGDIEAADVAGFSCVMADGLMKVRLRSGARYLWGSLSEASQDRILADPELLQGFVASETRCKAYGRDPAVRAWADRQRRKTAAANRLAAEQHPDASFAEEFGRQAGSMFTGAGKGLAKGAGATALAFLKTAWPVLLGGGLLWWGVGARARKVAGGYAGRGARRVGGAFQSVGRGTVQAVRQAAV